MIKQAAVVVGCMGVAAICGYVASSTVVPKTKIRGSNAILIYSRCGQKINACLTPEESTLLKGILNNRRLYSDSPSCGFDEDISIRFGDQIFCVAHDTCPTIVYSRGGDKDCDAASAADRLCMTISKTEREIIDQIFEKYGGFFPCTRTGLFSDPRFVCC
ncbi:MAG: hypothetical protein FWF71_01115 [Actinomycetia bacterium]|nr:hypothetical protein [Actinomycetes bacterium]